MYLIHNRERGITFYWSLFLFNKYTVTFYSSLNDKLLYSEETVLSNFVILFIMVLKYKC